MRVKIGVMGSAGGDMKEEALKKCFTLGQEIARNNCITLTGACPGLPHEAVLGAKSEGGMVVGISPGLSLDEHVERYHSPYLEYDVIIYTGSGLMGREITNIRSCDIVLIVGGRSGTLGEFSIAYDEGKLIGVLEGTGGIADHLHEIVAIIDKETRAHIIYDDEPRRLIGKLLAEWDTRVREGVAHMVPEVDG